LADSTDIDMLEDMEDIDGEPKTTDPDCDTVLLLEYPGEGIIWCSIAFRKYLTCIQY
jgi:hypothetical protein